MRSLSSFRKLSSTKSFGIEIEGFFDHDKLTQDDGRYGFFYATFDVSVDGWFPGYRAREFVSQPLPKEWLKKEITRLEKRVGMWFYNYSCGIHIHVNRAWCTKEKAKLIYNVVKALTDEDMATLFGRGPNNYCRRDGFGETRYCCVNIENKKTVEFRMFSGGDAKWARYCVDMVDFMVHNATILDKDKLFAAHEMFKLG